MRSEISRLMDSGVKPDTSFLWCYWYVAMGICLLLNPTATVAAKEAAFVVDSSQDSVLVRKKGRTVLSYRQTPNPCKPYLELMTTPNGLQILRDGPEDHRHHHGLMFALRGDEADFWAEEKSAVDPAGGNGVTCVGRQIPRLGVSARVCPSSWGTQVVMSTQLDWLAAGSSPLLVEQRKLTLYPIDSSPDCTLLTWHSRLEVAPGLDAVKLWGTHYHGLGMRLATPMDGQGKFLVSSNAGGEAIRGAEQLYSGPWCAYASPYDGSFATVVMLDHPGNARPVRWFTMAKPFAYLAATLGLDREPFTLEQGDAVDLKYGVAVIDGEVGSKQIDGLYRLWLERIR